VNVMVGPGAPDVAALAAIGVARVSVGPAIAQSAYGATARATHEMLSAGTYVAMNDCFDYAQLTNLIARGRLQTHAVEGTRISRRSHYAGG
jgi:2-methylisocitrate lyase-like PEP mutase family enzyme